MRAVGFGETIPRGDVVDDWNEKWVELVTEDR